MATKMNKWKKWTNEKNVKEHDKENDKKWRWKNMIKNEKRNDECNDNQNDKKWKYILKISNV